mmetsp:Transcript_22650/g.36499  ORF Transcript_22650/g.36499 Transcript_22650/m.36499 type:complete len:110 (+) Transcript_22650:107-436(+)
MDALRLEFSLDILPRHATPRQDARCKMHARTGGVPGEKVSPETCRCGSRGSTPPRTETFQASLSQRARDLSRQRFEAPQTCAPESLVSPFYPAQEILRDSVVTPIVCTS